MKIRFGVDWRAFRWTILEWLGAAPVYDSGTSLWYGTARVGRIVESKPFKKSHDEQIKLVQDLNWYNFDALNGIDKTAGKIFAQSIDIDESRRLAITKFIMERAGHVERLSRQKPSIIAGLDS